jgi:hypothetical protein
MNISWRKRDIELLCFGLDRADNLSVSRELRLTDRFLHGPFEPQVIVPGGDEFQALYSNRDQDGKGQDP